MEGHPHDQRHNSGSYMSSLKEFQQKNPKRGPSATEGNENSGDDNRYNIDEFDHDEGKKLNQQFHALKSNQPLENKFFQNKGASMQCDDFYEESKLEQKFNQLAINLPKSSKHQHNQPVGGSNNT